MPLLNRAYIVCTLMSISMFCISSYTPVYAKSDRDSINVLIQKGRWKSAEKKLCRLISKDPQKVDRQSKHEYTKDLIRVYIQLHEYTKAQQTLQKISKSYSDESEVIVLRGMCYYYRKNKRKARSVLEFVEMDMDPEISAESKLYLAHMDFEKKKYPTCIAGCNDISYLKDIEKSVRIKPSRLASLQKKAKELAERAQDALDDARFGAQYALYRKARQADIDKEFKKALGIYAQIKSPLFKAAALCYSAKCYRALGNIKKAHSLYTQFLSPSHPNPFVSLYKNEALLQLAFSQYLQGAEVDAVQRTLEKALENFKNPQVANATRIKEHPDMALMKRITHKHPSPEMFKDAHLGSILPSTLDKRVILNAQTAPWYTPVLQAETHLFYAYICSQRGSYLLAQRHFDTFLGISQQYGEGLFDNNSSRIDRLKTEGSYGSYLISPKAWAQLRGKNERRLKLALFSFISNKPKVATYLLTTKSTKAKKSKTKAKKADTLCTILLKGSIQCKEAKFSAASTTLRIFKREHTKTAFTPIALLILGNSYSAQKGRTSMALSAYRTLWTKHKDTSFAPRALLAAAIMCANEGNYRQAKKYARDIRRKFPDSRFKYPAAVLIRNMPGNKDDESLEEKSLLESLTKDDIHTTQRPPQFITITRVFNFPHDLSFHEPEDIHLNDVWLYRCSYVTASPCIRVTNFTVTFTELEPQIIPTNKRKIAFIRMPSLYKNLKTF